MSYLTFTLATVVLLIDYWQTQYIRQDPSRTEGNFILADADEAEIDAYFFVCWIIMTVVGVLTSGHH